MRDFGKRTSLVEFRVWTLGHVEDTRALKFRNQKRRCPGSSSPGPLRDAKSPLDEDDRSNKKRIVTPAPRCLDPRSRV